MAHDSLEVDGEETEPLREGAGNRDEKSNHERTNKLQLQSRKHERETEARKKGRRSAQQYSF
jgi:hypothetical protein